jgi:hypothetical protein
MKQKVSMEIINLNAAGIDVELNLRKPSALSVTLVLTKKYKL